ncbi:MAG: hypothetical protein LBT42_07075 [Tannerella sp.]|jgi:ligand-binding sensor domain-containing protein|nr:hypothetical protein [Tannerella sp.]
MNGTKIIKALKSSLQTCIPAICLLCLLHSCGQSNTLLPVPKQDISPNISFLNIRSICQDSMGYIWIATLHGLNRYNGYEFVQYFHDKTDENSIGNDMVHLVYYDSHCRLWIGTFGGIDEFDFKTNRFIHYSNFMPSALFETARGQILLAAIGGVYAINTLNNEIKPLSEELSGVNYLWEDGSMRLWAACNSGIAELQSDSTWKTYPLQDNRIAFNYFEDPKNLWWVGTNAGLAWFDHVKRIFVEPPSQCLNHPDLRLSKITFLQEIEKFKLLIGTETNGFFLYDMMAQTLQHDEPWKLNKTGSKELLSSFVDNCENVWVGTFDRGISIWN